MTQVHTIVIAAEAITVVLWIVYFAYALRIVVRLNNRLPAELQIPYSSAFLLRRAVLSSETMERHASEFPLDRVLGITHNLRLLAGSSLLVTVCLDLLARIFR